VAVTGCRPAAGERDRGLLLIGSDGAQLPARLDEGGFSHYYGHGRSIDMEAWSRASLNAACEAFEDSRAWVARHS
jgi:hypothetical protein